ncbi:hypothetical protein ACTMU2_27630 [Cupriavidus basilensis]
MAAPDNRLLTGTDPLRHHAVFNALTDSRASLERAAVLGDGLGLALWRNRHDDTAYAQPGHHTLSVYLEGGHSTYRLDQPGNLGAPGRLCVLPADHESRWHVGGTQRFPASLFRSPVRGVALRAAAGPRAARLAVA